VAAVASTALHPLILPDIENQGFLETFPVERSSLRGDAVKRSFYCPSCIQGSKHRSVHVSRGSRFYVWRLCGS